MSDDELVEKARTAAEKVYGTQFFNEEIDAALAAARPVIRAQALEEAARVTEQPLGGMYKDVEVRGLYATAIRALKEKE